MQGRVRMQRDLGRAFQATGLALLLGLGAGPGGLAASDPSPPAPDATQPGKTAPRPPENAVIPLPAHCPASLEALQARLPAVQDGKRREEAKLLLDKAAIDDRHGHGDLCAKAVDRASHLMD